MIVVALELPADFRLISVGTSSLVNDVRDSFGCNDRRAPKVEHPPKLSPAKPFKETIKTRKLNELNAFTFNCFNRGKYRKMLNMKKLKKAQILSFLDENGG